MSNFVAALSTKSKSHRGTDRRSSALCIARSGSVLSVSCCSRLSHTISSSPTSQTVGGSPRFGCVAYFAVVGLECGRVLKQNATASANLPHVIDCVASCLWTCSVAAVAGTLAWTGVADEALAGTARPSARNLAETSIEVSQGHTFLSSSLFVCLSVCVVCLAGCLAGGWLSVK